MNLPDIYIPVNVKDKFDRLLGVGFLDTTTDSLYFFSSQGVIEYNNKEIIELFILTPKVEAENETL